MGELTKNFLRNQKLARRAQKKLDEENQKLDLDATIDETNFRIAAKDAVKKYFEMGMLVDALFWRIVIVHYEHALEKK